MINISTKRRLDSEDHGNTLVLLKLWGGKLDTTTYYDESKLYGKPKAPMELVAIDDEYFIAKFASIDDYEFAKYEGPWLILHYLIVKECTPNFDPSAEILTLFRRIQRNSLHG